MISNGQQRESFRAPFTLDEIPFWIWLHIYVHEVAKADGAGMLAPPEDVIDWLP